MRGFPLRRAGVGQFVRNQQGRRFTMTKYARDEFDRVPETSTRQGVHRAVAESRRRRLAPILAVGAAALAVGLVAFLILPKLGFSTGGDTAAVSAEQGAGSAASSPPAPQPDSLQRRHPRARPARRHAPRASATALRHADAAAAAVDKTQPVAIYNGTTTAGLANRVGGTVSTAGWTLGQLGQLGRRARSRRSVDLLQRRRAEGQRRGPRQAPRHRHRGGLGRVPACRSSWCSAPASSSPFRLRLNNYWRPSRRSCAPAGGCG